MVSCVQQEGNRERLKVKQQVNGGASRYSDGARHTCT